MKIGAKYSHLNGLEWMMVHQKGIWREIQEVIRSIDADQFRIKKSKEKRMMGQMKIAPIAINVAMKSEFGKRGWEHSFVRYYVTDDYGLTSKILRLILAEQEEKIRAAGKRLISSYHQTDFQKNRVAVEVQLGKYSFIEFDLFVKHLGFYIGNTIDVGVEIVPMKKMQEQMSSGPGYYERVLHHIARQGRGAPAVPLILIGVEP